MSESKSGAQGMAIAAGIAVLGAIVWLFFSGSPGSDERAAEPPRSAAPVADSEAPPPGPSAPVPDAFEGRRIGEGGRITLEGASLPESLALDLPDDARGTGERTLRIVSVDGRRLDTTATPLPGRGTGLRLELDPHFLSVGRYMIEVDTVARGPLALQRYVLEVR